MAVVSPVPAIAQGVNSMRCRDVIAPGIMSGRREITEEPVARVIEEKIYVAVGKDVERNKSVLFWALQNSGGKRICIIHVHQPAKMIPVTDMGTKFPASKVKEQEVKAYREIGRQEMQKNLDKYLLLCLQSGVLVSSWTLVYTVQAEKLYIEMDSIEEGILKMISENGIRMLVMGGAADKHYPKYKPHKKAVDLKSKKAISVREHAPASCHTIWFLCKGLLIYTRKISLDVTDTENASSSSSLPARSNLENHFRSLSVIPLQTSHVKPSTCTPDSLRRVRSENFYGRAGSVLGSTFPDGNGGLSTPQRRSDAEGSSDESDGLSRRRHQSSVLSSSSSSGMADAALVPYTGTEVDESGLESIAMSQAKENFNMSSLTGVLNGAIDDTLYNQLQQVMAEAANSRREAFEEAARRAKAEKGALEAMRRVQASEFLYTQELKQRKEIEEAFTKEKEQLDKMKNQRDEVMVELQEALDQKSSLEKQIVESEKVVKELEEKIISAVELLQNYKKEREELQMERDNALKEAEELRKSRAETSGAHMPQFFTEFSFSEIQEATHNFDPSLKIGEGGYGSIYKGLLRHATVAIKRLHSHSLQGPSEFQQEVDVLSKMRHPNLVTLIGACPEAWTLIYEYLPNGSLEDRLSCRDNSPPLSWQTRIRIATELCSVLIFLQSSKPHGIVHGDLKPANILLDANFVTKLSDFGICRLLNKDTTVCCRTGPKGTFVYMDPEFLATGELTPKADVYSFGVILLRLLTGKQALGITKEVQNALDNGHLKNLLDPLAGDWPFVQAEQLANLALRCCEMNRKSRPDLSTDVWRVLEPMRASCGGSSSFQLGSEEHCLPPSYFICPIFQEVMRDPHVAADGFTYEAEALRGWLDSGHDTSPMTNDKLAHRNLVPNLALRSAIQEWLQQH
ncbi:PREDICTED: U-box domain-containing protein 33 isoform X1 [Theobroma cacao]|uniref:RING-type E3 ubiquitin transferase n=1 Tax=Theobroma cacao TaxID=3641 RepID=A0AB32WFT7_THECC|nr:PREDICTED: U-box domain-containing protein 33 isoform X1 [Theobroma cacao]